jgi:hypothetical protein
MNTTTTTLQRRLEALEHEQGDGAGEALTLCVVWVGTRQPTERDEARIAEGFPFDRAVSVPPIAVRDHIGWRLDRLPDETCESLRDRAAQLVPRHGRPVVLLDVAA